MRATRSTGYCSAEGLGRSNFRISSCALLFSQRSCYVVVLVSPEISSTVLGDIHILYHCSVDNGQLGECENEAIPSPRCYPFLKKLLVTQGIACTSGAVTGLLINVRNPGLKPYTDLTTRFSAVHEKKDLQHLDRDLHLSQTLLVSPSFEDGILLYVFGMVHVSAAKWTSRLVAYYILAGFPVFAGDSCSPITSGDVGFVVYWGYMGTMEKKMETTIMDHVL